uniref:Uncharacterized protein n=1 Tax=Hanusia phi TaxID=3032 RepID=A0A7S0NFJ7_9CRYP|mmetsp:Transcript_8977/g.20574  ORF Transcript_8977/g.20574 Transcript_8977/m.20574 type:complete len:277 (+) Transcript_8977:17-847(+)|eukprot:752013-Hanusia_phi.AAC.2
MPPFVQLDHGRTWVSRPGVRSRSSVLRARFNELSHYQLTADAYEKLLREVRLAEAEETLLEQPAQTQRPTKHSGVTSKRGSRYMSTQPMGAWCNYQLEEGAQRRELNLSQVSIGGTITSAVSDQPPKPGKRHQNQLERRIISSRFIRDTTAASEQAICAIETLSMRNHDLSEEADILFEQIEKLKNESKMQQEIIGRLRSEITQPRSHVIRSNRAGEQDNIPSEKIMDSSPLTRPMSSQKSESQETNVHKKPKGQRNGKGLRATWKGGAWRIQKQG